MSNDKNFDWKKRALELEAELADRNADLRTFRDELDQTNRKLEALISHLHKDVKSLHDLQRALVPTELPHIPGFSISSKFTPSLVQGGDYFDVFEHRDRLRFGLLAASSSGHSVSAQLLSILLQMGAQMEARRGSSPDLIVRKISQEVQKEMKDNDSVDLFFSRIDRRQFTMDYCLLGDLRVFLQRHESKKIKTLEPTNDKLSLSLNQKIKPAKLNLNSEDRLILCSPGVERTANLDGEHFGVERIYKTLLALGQVDVHELRNRLLHEVEAFSGGQEIKRDQTLIVLQVKAGVIKLAESDS